LQKATKATKSHKTPQNATKSHKRQKATKFLWLGSSGKIEVFFVKSFGRDRLFVSNGKTGKCHFVADPLSDTSPSRAGPRAPTPTPDHRTDDGGPIIRLQAYRATRESAA
jgi:hypothetical protein